MPYSAEYGTAASNYLLFFFKKDSGLLFSDQIDHPLPLSDHRIADHTLDEIQSFHDYIKRKNRYISIMSDDEGRRNADQPQRSAVEDKRDERLASGTQCEIAGIGICMHRHHKR